MTTKNLLNYFKNNGFVVLRNFFNNNEKNMIINATNKLYNLPDIKNSSYGKYYENLYNDNNEIKRTLSRIEKIYTEDKDLKGLIDNKILPTLNEFEGKNMTLFKDKLNWKLPGGGEFRPHQDFEAWTDFPPKYYVSCALFADNCTNENGCLEFAAGGLHKKGILPYDKNDKCIEPELVKLYEWITIPATQNDMLIFDAFVPHRSSKNLSDKRRGVYYFTFNEEKYGNFYDDYYRIKRKAFPQDIDREDGMELDLNSKYNFANPIS